MISVVVPAYNESELIADCIKSINAEFAGSAYEVIVADNGSTDSTAEVARALGATVVTEPRKGVTRARQAGFEATNPDYHLVAFIDADNTIPPGWLDLALKPFNEDGVVAVSGPVVYPDLRIHKRFITFMFYLAAKVAHEVFPMIQGGNFILDKEALIKVGGFDTAIDFYGEDTSTAVRLTKAGKIKFVLGMFAYSSARRLQSEGLFVTGGKYVINYLWMWVSGKPWTTEYYDHRPK